MCILFRMVYITGSKEQNALALKLVIQKVGGRSFGGEPKEEPLDPATEECLYIPSIAVTSVLNMASGSVDIQGLLEKFGVSLRTSSCNSVETGLTTVRVILKGPEQGRAVVHSYLSDALARWRSAGGPSGGLEDIDPSRVSMNADAAVNKELETSLKLTVPNNMISIVLGTDNSIVDEIFRLTNASIRITNQTSPSAECDLVVVVVTGLTAHIIKAQEILLLRMLNSKIPLPRLPVQLSNTINASSGGISSSLMQANAPAPAPVVGPMTSTSITVSSATVITSSRPTLESASQQQLKQIEMQMQYLQMQRQSVLSGATGVMGGVGHTQSPSRQPSSDVRRNDVGPAILYPNTGSMSSNSSAPSNQSGMVYQRSNSGSLVYNPPSNANQQVYYVSSGNSQSAPQNDMVYAMLPVSFDGSSQGAASSNNSSMSGGVFMSSAPHDNNVAYSSGGQRPQPSYGYSQASGGMTGPDRSQSNGMMYASSNPTSSSTMSSSNLSGVSSASGRALRSNMGLNPSQQSGMTASIAAEMERNMSSADGYSVSSAPYGTESSQMMDRFGNSSGGGFDMGLSMPQNQLDNGATYYHHPVYQSQATMLTPAVHGRPSPPSPTLVIVSPQASPLTGYGLPLGAYNDEFSMFTDSMYFGGQGGGDMNGLNGGGGVSYLMGYAGPTGGFSDGEYAAAEAAYARVFSPPSPSVSMGVPANFNNFEQFSSAPADGGADAMNKKRVNTMSRNISKNLRNSESLGK